MTGREFAEVFRRSQQRQDATKSAILEYARGLVSALQDAGRPSSAKELERLIFEHDAAVQELEATAAANPESFLEFIRSMGRPT